MAEMLKERTHFPVTTQQRKAHPVLPQTQHRQTNNIQLLLITVTAMDMVPLPLTTAGQREEQ